MKKTQHGLAFGFAALVVLLSCSRHEGSGAPAAASATSAAARLAEPTTLHAEAAWQKEWHTEYMPGKDPRKDWATYAPAVRQELAALGPDAADIVAKATQLGPDPQKIFEFMRDQVSLEPYAGSMRGAKGTLLGGSGNALDRALLAQELLKAHKIASRLISGRLTAAQAEEILGRFAGAGSLPPALKELETEADASQLEAAAAASAARMPLPQAGIAALLRHAEQQGQMLSSQISTLTAARYEQLAKAIEPAKARIRFGVDAAALRATLLERLQTHYWLELQNRNGKWTAFDPSFADAKLGQQFGTAPTVLAAVPADAQHELRFSLVYVAARDGAPAEDTLVAGTMRAADALFGALAFEIQPIGVDLSAKSTAGMSASQRAALVRGAKRFRAVLRTGGTVATSRAFDLQGNIFDSPTALAPPAASGSIADALGGASDSAPQFGELRVVLQLTGPGHETLTQVRTLVRGSDTQSAEFVPPLNAWEILLQPQWVSTQWVAARGLEQLLYVGDALFGADAAGNPAAAKAPPPAASQLLLQMALQRQRSLVSIMRGKPGIVPMIDEPLVTIYGVRLDSTHQADGGLAGERYIDLVSNALRIIPATPADGPVATEIALRNGASDNAIEISFLGAVARNANVHSGSTVFGRALSEKRSPMFASVQDIDKLRTAGVSERDIEWIHDNEPESDRLLIVTAADGTSAWWTIRPDGNSILRVSGGRGQSTLEYVMQGAEVAGTVLCILESTNASEAQSDPEMQQEVLMHHLWECVLSSALSGGAGLGATTLHAAHMMPKVASALHILIGFWTLADIMGSLGGIREFW